MANLGLLEGWSSDMLSSLNLQVKEMLKKVNVFKRGIGSLGVLSLLYFNTITVKYHGILDALFV